MEKPIQIGIVGIGHGARLVAQLGDQELHEKMEQSKAPRVTMPLIESRIKETEFINHGTLTICILTLKNGIKIIGESACVDPANYDQAIGETIARKNAVDKMWILEGYVLANLLQRMREPAPEQGGDVSATAQSLVANSMKVIQPESIDNEDFIDMIGKTCHEACRAYNDAIGDPALPAWEDAPDEMKNSVRAGVVAHLTSVLNPAQSHAAWMAQRQADGWKWGPVKNSETKEHPNMVPFDELSVAQKAKDHIFRSIVKTLSQA